MSNPRTAKVSPQEQRFLDWFEAELRSRLEEEHIVVEESLFSAGELMAKASSIVDPDWDNLPFFGRHWERIGGPGLARRMIRDYRRRNPMNSGPSPMRIRNMGAKWRQFSAQW